MDRIVLCSKISQSYVNYLHKSGEGVVKPQNEAAFRRTSIFNNIESWMGTRAKCMLDGRNKSLARITSTISQQNTLDLPREPSWMYARRQ